MKIQLSGLLSDISGRLGGSVASRNKQGHFLRTYVVPRDSTAGRKFDIRSRFSQIASGWRNLSQASKLDWANKALTYTFTDAKGNNYVPTGYQLFVYVNLSVFPCITTIVTTPINYSLLTNPFVQFDQYRLSIEDYSLTVFDPDTVNEHLKVFVSKFYPTSVSLTNVPMHYIGFLEPSGGTPWNMYDQINAISGRVGQVGEKFYIRYYSVDTVLGKLSPWMGGDSYVTN